MIPPPALQERVSLKINYRNQRALETYGVFDALHRGRQVVG